MLNKTKNQIELNKMLQDIFDLAKLQKVLMEEFAKTTN